MKKVLVTGASGSIGLNVIKYLLSEGKYEITALDLKNKKSINNLKRYQRRINIIYGDVTDELLMTSLVRDHDYIIYLASVMPPLGEFSIKLGELVEYQGIQNVIKTINYYNENCHLIYASTTSVYDESLTGSVKERIKVKGLDNFSLNKYNAENLISKRLKHYTILRVPLVLGNIKKEPFIYNVKKDSIIEVTTNIDAAYAFVQSLKYLDKLNKKTFNIGLGQTGVVKYDEILTNILKYYGISMRYILSRIFLEKSYKSPILRDSDELDNIIHYRNDSLYNYYRRLERIGKKRVIQKTLAKPIIYFKTK